MKKSVKRSLDAYIRQMDRIDLRVIACVILLNVFGLIMIYSASAYSCSTLAKYNYDSLYLLKKQGIFVLAGIVVMLLLQYFNYNYLQKACTDHLFGFSGISLFAENGACCTLSWCSALDPLGTGSIAGCRIG